MCRSAHWVSQRNDCCLSIGRLKWSAWRERTRKTRAHQMYVNNICIPCCRTRVRKRDRIPNWLNSNWSIPRAHWPRRRERHKTHRCWPQYHSATTFPLSLFENTSLVSFRLPSVYRAIEFLASFCVCRVCARAQSQNADDNDDINDIVDNKMLYWMPWMRCMRCGYWLFGLRCVRNIGDKLCCQSKFIEWFELNLVAKQSMIKWSQSAFVRSFYALNACESIRCELMDEPKSAHSRQTFYSSHSIEENHICAAAMTRSAQIKHKQWAYIVGHCSSRTTEEKKTFTVT